MSKQQISELDNEISQMVSADERALLEYEIRFWRNKAWRTEQQKDRAEAAQKEAEAIAEKYKSIPEGRLNALLDEINQEELVKARSEAEKRITLIGLSMFLKLSSDSESINGVDAKIRYWNNISENYRRYIPEEVVSDDDV